MAAALADPEARSFLRDADPVLAQVIDAQPDFHRARGSTSSRRSAPSGR
jgi:hypothetical protein